GCFSCFFFQAEDGIRDFHVTGVQTCALPISRQRPSRDWLAFVKTARARQKIRHWIRQEEFESSVALGRDLLERELKKARKERPRSEERRVGKECRTMVASNQLIENSRNNTTE